MFHIPRNQRNYSNKSDSIQSIFFGIRDELRPRFAVECLLPVEFLIRIRKQLHLREDLLSNTLQLH